MQDDYELEENGAGLMAQQVPYHWRMRAHSLGHGAFHGLKVTAALLHGVAQKASSRSLRSALQGTLKAGVCWELHNLFGCHEKAQSMASLSLVLCTNPYHVASL